MLYTNARGAIYAASFIRAFKKLLSKSALLALIFSFIAMPIAPALAVFDDYEGEHRVLNQGFSLQPSETSGAMIYEVPITAPPGRNGMHPDLKLSYNSLNTLETGVFGYGWSLNTPYIERVNKRGVEDMYSDNYFYSSLDGELREVDQGMAIASLSIGEIGSYAYSILDESETSALSESDATSLNTLLADAKPAERATLKGKYIAKLDITDTIPREKYNIQIIRTNAIQGGVEVFARAWDKKGKQIGFGRDGSVDIERFVIINPPILVDDSAGDIVREWTDSTTGEPRTRKLREDLKEALLQVLEHTISVKQQKFGDSRIISGKIGNTTLTAYPNGGTGTAPIDSALDRTNANGESYSTIRNGAGTTANDTGSNEPVPYLKARSGGSSWSDGAETNLRGGFGFDTSSIGSDQVDSATFSLWVTSTKIVTGWAAEDVVELTAFTPADGSDFVASDYNIANHGSTRLATGIDLASMTTGAYNNWTLNASGEAAINKSSNTFFSTRWKFDVDNVDPPTWENNNMYSFVYLADQSGTTNDPKLVVEHSEGPPPDPGASGLLQDLSYEYDNVGNITKIFDIGGYNSAKITDYLYDDLYRLTTASTTFATTTSDYKRTYAYDALGNITNKSDQGAYGYGGNQGASYANPHAVTDIASTTSYSYDKNGNLTSDSIWTYGWNYNNTLASSTNGAITVNYGYDHNKQRISYDTGTNTLYYPNKYYNISTASTTRHIFAGNQLVAAIEGTGTATTTNYIHTDHLGGTHIVTDENGEVTQLLDYYPFGEARLNEIAGFDEQRKFTGYERDADTGLDYANARYYGNTVGRFTGQDPAFWAVGDRQALEATTGAKLQAYLSNPQGLNSYSYSFNNPLQYIDPNGESGISVVTKVLGRSLSKLAGPLSVVSYGYDLFKPDPAGGDLSAGGSYSNTTVSSGSSSNLSQESAGVGPGSIVAGVSRQSGIQSGTRIPGLGEVIENASGRITGFVRENASKPFHGLDQAITRGVSPGDILNTVKDPLITIRQGNGNIYRLTEQAAVVLNQAGKVVTTYGKSDFLPKVVQLLSKVK